MSVTLIYRVVILFCAALVSCAKEPIQALEPVVEDEVPMRILPVGVTMGLETVDHLTEDLEGCDCPSIIRFFYHQDKDLPRFVAPVDYDEDIRPVREITEPDYSTRYYELSNWIRLRRLKETCPNSLYIISTEIAVDPTTRELSTFPNRNFRFAQWGSEAKVAEWAYAFVANVNDVLGVGTWYWQLSSEPWDTDWHRVRDAYWATLDSMGDQIRPLVMSPALPIGQDDGSGFGVNRWYEGTIATYLGGRGRDYDAISMHAYPLEGLTWTADPRLVLGKVKQGLEIRDQFAPDAKFFMTEFGVPHTWAPAEDMARCVIEALEALLVDGVTMYNYAEGQGEGTHFEDCYLRLDTCQYVPYYDLVTRAR